MFPFRRVGTSKRNRSGPLFQAVADPCLCRSVRRLTERHRQGSSNQKYRTKVTPPHAAFFNIYSNTTFYSNSRLYDVCDPCLLGQTSVLQTRGGRLSYSANAREDPKRTRLPNNTDRPLRNTTRHSAGKRQANVGRIKSAIYAGIISLALERAADDTGLTTDLEALPGHRVNLVVRLRI